jgi:hypothetical protein
LHSSLSRNELVGMDFATLGDSCRGDNFIVLNSQAWAKCLDKQAGAENCPHQDGEPPPPPLTLVRACQCCGKTSRMWLLLLYLMQVARS